MTTALARLVKEAPDIAREVMPANLSVEDVAVWVSHGEEAPIPAWFYSAVAGKLAEWLAGRDIAILPTLADIWWRAFAITDCPEPLDGTTNHPTFLDALVEAAIVVGREGK